MYVKEVVFSETSTPKRYSAEVMPPFNLLRY